MSRGSRPSRGEKLRDKAICCFGQWPPIDGWPRPAGQFPKCSQPIDLPQALFVYILKIYFELVLILVKMCKFIWLLLLLICLHIPGLSFQQFPHQQQQTPNFKQMNTTQQCLDLAQFRDCSVFTHCCNRLCPGRGHKCLAFLGMIDQGQSACDCPPLSTQFGQSGSQLPSTFNGQNGQQPMSTSSPSPTAQWPFQSGAAASSSQQQWPSPSAFSSSPGQNTAGPSRPSPFTRPQPGNPSALRPLFQSTASSSSSGIQRIGRASWWSEFGRKADFVGGIMLVFVLDLLLLSFTL